MWLCMVAATIGRFGLLFIQLFGHTGHLVVSRSLCVRVSERPPKVRGLLCVRERERDLMNAKFHPS